MVYVQYERLKIRYIKSQINYEELIKEKEDLFAKTQPSAQKLDKERVMGGQSENAFEKYLVRKEEASIEERLEEARAIVADWEKLLEIKRVELENSSDVYDRIYYLKYIKKKRVKKISQEINYSVSQTNRKIKEIRDNVNRITKQEY